MDFNSFMNFDKMLTPTIIKIVFWIGVGGSILMGLLQMINGGVFVLLGLMMIVIGPLVVRVNCEILIIFFKMHETLLEIKASTSNQYTTIDTPVDRTE